MTDEICEEIADTTDRSLTSIEMDNMRRAADWQFEEDARSVEALLWIVCSWTGESFEVLDPRIKHYLDMFKESYNRG